MSKQRSSRRGQLSVLAHSPHGGEIDEARRRYSVPSSDGPWPQAANHGRITDIREDEASGFITINGELEAEARAVFSRNPPIRVKCSNGSCNRAAPHQVPSRYWFARNTFGSGSASR